jgi:hypothetical protein
MILENIDGRIVNSIINPLGAKSATRPVLAFARRPTELRRTRFPLPKGLEYPRLAKGKVAAQTQPTRISNPQALSFSSRCIRHD